MKRILLLEDDSSLGATLSERLEKEGYEVLWARSLRAGGQALSEQSFDLAILDVGLPDGSGFDFAIDLRKDSLMPFVFVTARAEAQDRLKGYEIGAEEYIPKPFHLKELLMRVRHVLENHSLTPPLEKGGVRVDIDSLSIHRGGQIERLSVKEAHLLKLLVDRSPKPVSRDEILNLIWGQDEYPSNRTVDNMILRLRQLLGPELGAGIESVRGVGYRWFLNKDGQNG